MNLVGLKAQNIKILKAVNIKFKEKGVVYISGKNNQGKSTVIDLIHIALAGKSHYKDQTKMRREGIAEDDEAYVIADLEEYVVKRWFKASGNDYIEIKNKDDIKQGSPETLLSKFYSDHCRNPQHMIDMDKAEQVQFIYTLMGIEEKIASLDEEYEKVYMERRDINRDLKAAEGHLKSLREPPEDLPEKIDVSEEMKRLDEIESKNAELAERKSKKVNERDSKKKEKSNIQARIDRLREELEEAEGELEDAEDRIEQLDEQIAGMDDPFDTSGIKDKINRADDINKKHQAAEEYRRAKQNLEDLQTDSQQKTDHLEEIEGKKQDLMKENELPVEGVTIEEGELHKDGYPVTQLSTTESIKFWSKLFIATDPRLRLMTLERGESLDSENRKELEKFAEENEFLYIVEVVDEAGKTGIVIENGMVKANHSKGDI